MPDAHKDEPRRCKDKDELALDALAVHSQKQQPFHVFVVIEFVTSKPWLSRTFHSRSDAQLLN